MPFKYDAISKFKKVLKEIYETYPHIYLYSTNSTIEYYKDIVPLLHERLNGYELSVFIEALSLDIAGTYNETYYSFQKVYNAVIMHKIDPSFVLGEFFNETKGFSGISGERPGNP